MRMCTIRQQRRNRPHRITSSAVRSAFCKSSPISTRPSKIFVAIFSHFQTCRWGFGRGNCSDCGCFRNRLSWAADLNVIMLHPPGTRCPRQLTKLENIFLRIRRLVASSTDSNGSPLPSHGNWTHASSRIRLVYALSLSASKDWTVFRKLTCALVVKANCC